MSYSQMMARMKKADAAKEIANKLKTNYATDERFWSPTLDDKGNSKAIIRFLPAPEGESEDFVKYFTHYIVGSNGKKYIERCRTSLNEKDPAQELAVRLGANDKSLYAKYGKSPRYVTNILVINDPAKPDNNGKVFLFEFGNKIMDKIHRALKGSDDALDPRPAVNIFCPATGSNFKVIVKKKGGFNNYDDCEFMTQSALFEGNDKKIEATWKQAHALQPEIAATKFKSYEQLSDLLRSVVGDLDDTAVSSPQSPRAAKPTATVSSQRVAKAKTEELDDDPDSVFDDLLKNTDTLSADDAVDSMFADD